MPDAVLTVTNNGADDPDGVVGNRITDANWPSGFDHATMVTNHRSRSDAFDFVLWHTTTGVVQLGQVTGNNGSACKFTFILAAQIIGGGGSDANYRLRFNNLSKQVTPFGSVSGATSANLSVSVSIPSVILPAPGWPLERIDIRDVDTNEYPEFLSARRTKRNQNPRSGYRLSWYHLTPDDWYAIRAHQHSVRGGAGAFSAPSWLGGSATYRYVSLPTLRQSSRLGYEADAVIEELVA